MHVIDCAVIVRVHLIGNARLLPEQVGEVGNGLSALSRIVLVVIADDQYEVVGELEARCLGQLGKLRILLRRAAVRYVADNDNRIVIGAKLGNVLEHVLHAVDVRLVIQRHMSVADYDELGEGLALVGGLLDPLGPVHRVLVLRPAVRHVPSFGSRSSTCRARRAATEKRSADCSPCCGGRDLDESPAGDVGGHGSLLAGGLSHDLILLEMLQVKERASTEGVYRWAAGCCERQHSPCRKSIHRSWPST